jgi:hypothetical protein
MIDYAMRIGDLASSIVSLNTNKSSSSLGKLKRIHTTKVRDFILKKIVPVKMNRIGGFLGGSKKAVALNTPAFI